MGALGWTVLLLIALVVAVVVVASFYRRATNGVSLVRTGVGGLRIVINGGALVVPYFQEVIRINMETLRLDVERRDDSSLITQDRLRVDVRAEFHVSVTPEREAISRAAQTLGRRTFHREELCALIDGMLVDALRSTAARMTMDELHEGRSIFVKEVGESLTDALSRYGLQLDSVSLTALDQTPFASLDENNAFNAVGMRKLAEVIATSKKERAEIDAESQVSVRRAAMEAARQQLDIELEERRAEIAQQQEIETLAAAQIAVVARRKAESELDAAKARIEMEQHIQAADILRERELAIAEHDRQIALSAKSVEESRSRAQAEAARAETVSASERVETARATAEAERRAALARIAADSEAGAAAARMKIAAEGEKLAAGDLAAARHAAAEATKAERLAEAEALQARIQAENTRSESLVAMEIERSRLAALPKIIEEMVKPAEKIKSINVNHVSGFGGREGSGGSPVTSTVDSILDMAVQLPMLKRIGDQLSATLDGNQDEGRPAKD